MVNVLAATIRDVVAPSHVLKCAVRTQICPMCWPLPDFTVHPGYHVAKLLRCRAVDKGYNIATTALKKK